MIDLFNDFIYHVDLNLIDIYDIFNLFDDTPIYIQCPFNNITFEMFILHYKKSNNKVTLYINNELRIIKCNNDDVLKNHA